MMDLDLLLERCRGGDPLAWEALVRSYQARVYGLAYSYVRDHEQARDVAQEIFVRVYRKLGSFRQHEVFLPWLLRLGRNICIDHLRRMKARPADTGIQLDDAPEVVDPSVPPDDAMFADSRRRLVHQAMQRLNEPFRELILLKEIQGLKIEEIASILSLPVGTVKSRSHRARLELARLVSELDPSAGDPAQVRA